MPPQKSESRGLDKVIVRLPDGMRDRIKRSADQNGRSMNAEIVQALEQYFPPEPSIDEVLDKIEMYVTAASSPDLPAYRKGLVEAILSLKERLEAGIDFDHPVSVEVMSPEEVEAAQHQKERQRWRHKLERESDRGGVTTADWKSFLESDALMWLNSERAKRAIEDFDGIGPMAGLRMVGLDRLEFADPEEAQRIFRQEMERIYARIQEREARYD